jgi:hypothetical protein
MRRLSLLAVLFLLCACATPPSVPDGYKGPIAHVWDTSNPRSGTSVDFFYIAEVNGRRIDNSLNATTRANSGRGFAMAPKVITRDIPAEPSKIRLVGRTHHAAPILVLMNKVYEVSGELEFTPEPDAYYYVRGVLKDDYSAVWLENASGVLVGQKFEIKGSSTLDFFNK